MTLNPAEKFAALKLLSDQLKVVVDQARDEADAYRQQTRAKSLETDYGTVSLTRRKPTITWDDDQLIAWCEDEFPNLVHKTIPTESKRWLETSYFRRDGEDVLFPGGDGEVVPFATVKPGSEYLAFRATAEAKGDVLALLSERVEDLTGLITRPAIEPESTPNPVPRPISPRPGVAMPAGKSGVCSDCGAYYPGCSCSYRP